MSVSGPTLSTACQQYILRGPLRGNLGAVALRTDSCDDGLLSSTVQYYVGLSLSISTSCDEDDDERRDIPQLYLFSGSNTTTIRVPWGLER
jgi:hypothetical protein